MGRRTIARIWAVVRGGRMVTAAQRWQGQERRARVPAWGMWMAGERGVGERGVGEGGCGRSSRVVLAAGASEEAVAGGIGGCCGCA